MTQHKIVIIIGEQKKPKKTMAIRVLKIIFAIFGIIAAFAQIIEKVQ